jgi:NADH dehydrogenase
MASLVAKSIRARLSGKALPTFKYRDFGNLVNMSEYSTVASLLSKGKRSVYLEGVFGRMMYWSLSKMHQHALHGSTKVALDTAVHAITRRTEPRIKLH